MSDRERPGAARPRSVGGTGRPEGGLSRRAFLGGAAAALGAPIPAACGSRPATGTGSSGDRLEYVVTSAQDWPSRAAADAAAIAATRNGIRATVRTLPKQNYDDAATQLVFSADPPAALWLDVSRARFADLTRVGALTDLSGLWPEALRDVRPGIADRYTTDGRRYGVPLSLDLYPLVWYNVALFRQLGIAPPLSGTRTWSETEFLEACAVLRAAGHDPLAVGGLELSHQLVEGIAGTILTGSELRHYTVDAWQPDSPYRYTDQAWVRVFTRLRDWARADVFQPRSAWVDQLAAQRAFVGGVCAMVGGGSWTLGDIERLPGGTAVELDWMLFPRITHRSRLLSRPGNGAVVPAASTLQGQAHRLLAFMLRPERMLAAAREYGHIPPVDLPGLTDVLDPRLATLHWFSTNVGGSCMDWPTELEAPYARTCRAVLAGTSTPEEAAQDLEDAASLARAAVERAAATGSGPGSPSPVQDRDGE